MAEYQRGPHTVHDIKYHFVWVTKYRKPILKGEVTVIPPVEFGSANSQGHSKKYRVLAFRIAIS